MRIKIVDSQVACDLLSGSIPNREIEVLISKYPPHYDPPLVRHMGEEFPVN